MKKILVIAAALFALGAFSLTAGEAPRKKAVSAGNCRGKHLCPRHKAQQGNCQGKGTLQRNKGCILCSWKYKMLREDDLVKFRKLARKIHLARMDYARTPSAQTEKALQTAIENMVKTHHAFEIDRAEKALARAKEEAREEKEIVRRIMDTIKRKQKKAK